jgi:replicative DNA helicase
MALREPARGIGTAFLRHVIEVGEPKPYRTGFTVLDMTQVGVFPGQLLVIGGDSGVAKTGLAERIALNLAAADIPTTYCQLELTQQRARERFLAKIHGSSPQGFYLDLRSELDEHVDAARASIATLDALPLQLIAPDPRPGDAKVSAWQPMTARQCFETAYRNGSKVLAIDHARELVGWLDGRTREGKHAATEIAREISELTVASGLGVILLHQLAIDPAHVNRRPNKGQFMDCRALVQKADAIVLVHRPFRAIGGIDDRIAELLIEKNRNGREGCAHTHFMPGPIDFASMTPEEAWVAECCRAANEKRAKQRAEANARREAADAK